MADADRLPGLGMLASVFAGRTVVVEPQGTGQPAWTDGHTIFVDLSSPSEITLASIAAQASMLAAGSLDPANVRALRHHSRSAKRYFALESHRALLANAAVLPKALALLGNPDVARRSGSSTESLRLASGKQMIDDPPPEFGVIRVGKLLAASARVANGRADDGFAHVPRSETYRELEELDDGEVDDSDAADLFTSPVGGGGFIGTWLQKLLSSARQTGTGAGPPGADSPTHRTNSGRLGAQAVSSLATAAREITDDPKAVGRKYPEWDAARSSYRADWCTVTEIGPTATASASQSIDEAVALRRPLARLGTGVHRRRRQIQGDDIDIDAAVEAYAQVAAGSAPDDALYLDSVRRRRDLSVLLLLDVSGSTAEPGAGGRTVHQQQRTAAANLTVALHDLGDRVALFAFYSQGRAAVSMVPLKRFDDHLDSQVIRRLNSLEPGAYSRLGAAIRHGSAVLEARGGTARRLLVVLSDGLAYDHGYERAHGAADARRALTEARRRGTGCVCLTVGAGTDAASLRAVFGSTAHASVARPDELTNVIGPLLRSALRVVEAQRRAS